MKIHKSILTALFGALAIAPSAKAATGDLIFAFRVTDQTDIAGGLSGNGTDDVEFDLGPASAFKTNNYTFNLGPDLTDVYGSNWDSASALVWSAAASTGSTNTNTLWATSPGDSNAWIRQAGSAQNPTRSAINGLLTDLTTPTGVTPGLNAYVVSASPAANNPNTYISEVGTDGNYNYSKFNPTIESGVSSTSPETADLYNLPSGSGVGNDWGTFTLEPDGDLQYAAVDATAVPEPANYAAALLGLAGLVAMRPFRRRS